MKTVGIYIKNLKKNLTIQFCFSTIIFIPKILKRFRKRPIRVFADAFYSSSSFVGKINKKIFPQEISANNATGLQFPTLPF